MIKLGIFILPNNKLKKEIIILKKKIKIIYGNIKYLDHIPHCTLYVINISKKFINLIKTKKIYKFNFKTKYIIEKFDVFYNDPITKGNTLILKIKKNAFLSNLQKKIISNLKENKIIIPKNYIDKKMNNNFKKFGYPFVGSNWKPHFTLASFAKSLNHQKFINSYKRKRIKFYTQSVNYIYFYEIKKNHHKLLFKKKIT